MPAAPHSGKLKSGEPIGGRAQNGEVERSPAAAEPSTANAGKSTGRRAEEGGNEESPAAPEPWPSGIRVRTVRELGNPGRTPQSRAGAACQACRSAADPAGVHS
jgi:hypothetical protein